MTGTTRHDDTERLGDEIATLAAHLAAATARWLALIADFDEREGWSDGAFKSCAEWLSWRCGIAPGTARDHVRVARGLCARPLIAAAFEAGELSYSKVRALLRVEDDVDEALLLDNARAASAGQLERIVRGYRSALAVERDADAQWAERELSWSWDEAGALVVRGRFPAELGALLVRALEAARDEAGPPPPAADPVSAETGSEPEPVAARNADALVALAQGSLAERTSSADVYQVVVHVDEAALTRSDEASCCELDDGNPLPPAAARRLACDASVVRLIERDGKPLSVGRKTRTIPPALRRALRIRDQGCAFPGCGQRHHTDAHHIEHWADGGETAIDNLVQLCRRHHRLLHEGGFSVRMAPSGAFVFRRPGGEVIPQAPRLPRGDCANPSTANRRRGISVSAETLFPVDPARRFDLGLAVDGWLDARVPVYLE